jgi:hypothetical protein
MAGFSPFGIQIAAPNRNNPLGGGDNAVLSETALPARL